MKRTTIVGAACAAALFLAISVPPGYGAEERGFLGVFLTPPAESSSGERDGVGARVEDVARGGAGEKAGLHRGDIITAMNGEKVEGPDALRSRMQSLRKGDTVQLDVRRGDETLKLEAKLGGPPAEAALPAEDTNRDGKRPGFLGIGFAEVPDALADHLDLEKGAGVMVGNVWKDSPAQKAGMTKNDVIVSVDGKPVRDAREIASHLESKNEGDVVKLGVIHKGKKSDLEIALGSRPAELRRRMMLPGASRRVTIESPDGSGRSITIPGDDLWPTDEILRELHENAGSFREWKHPEEWLGRLRSLVDELESKLGEPGDDTAVVQSHSSVMRVKDGEYDITISERDGSRKVTVKQGDKVLADEIPYAEIDKLPEDARERVEKAASGFEATPTPRYEIPQKKIKA